MNRIAGGDPEGKIYKLLSFAGSGRDVADPWYTGDFDATYRDVLAGCEGLLPPAIILIVISVILTMIAGLVPSRMAARKDPVEALRTE